jgi:hypothetical protein
MVMPGTYKVSMDLVARGEITRLADPVAFNAEPLIVNTLAVDDREALVAFQQKVTKLSRVFMGMDRKLNEDLGKIASLKQVALATPEADLSLQVRITEVEKELEDLRYKLHGPSAAASWEELPPMEMPLSRRLNVAIYKHWGNSAGLSGIAVEQFNILKEEFPPLVQRLHDAEAAIESLETALESVGAGWTPGRKVEL